MATAVASSLQVTVSFFSPRFHKNDHVLIESRSDTFRCVLAKLSEWSSNGIHI